MTVVRIVCAGGRRAVYGTLSLTEACNLTKAGTFDGSGGLYGAAFVEPAPLFQAVTYVRTIGPCSYHRVGGPAPLAEALATAAEERARDERAGIGYRWRTVVRAAR